ncbi:MAG: S46 family peptidase [Planctomycetes bacterium]|nr:S46 family peptidase [Planctomycetota bacterium]MBI3846354.1 S46 family peptidase [Planctomycetota bacterium]
MAVAPHVKTDEGMWTFDNPPTKLLQDNYGFTPTKEWLDHVRLASVRFNDGGSGSFVSANGLVMTNHHVASGQLQKVSTKEQNYLMDGFYARNAADEIKCPDLELNVLVSMEDVTSRVNAAVKPGASEKDANDQRKAEMSRIEKESTDKTGFRSDVIKLYEGGEYQLYRFKKYTDVRIVFAPEGQIAFYGGDPDNFTFPRYDLDCAFFRVYENDQPVHPEHYFKWSENGAADGDLVFVSGNPGSTDRLQTMAQHEMARDLQYPLQMKSFLRRKALLHKFSDVGPENARRAKNQLFGIENTVKARGAEFTWLQNDAFMASLAANEKATRDSVAADSQLSKICGNAWDGIAAAEKLHATFFKRQSFSAFRGTRFMAIAGQIVRYVAETKKPNDERFPEYRDSALESLQFALLSPAPIYKDLEETTFTDSLAETIEALGNDDPFVKAVLAGRTPAQVAHDAVEGTKLDDVAVRKALLDGGQAAVDASTDPMIVLARKIDPIARQLRKKYEDEVESAITQNSAKIAQARFKIYGKSVYPDATFSLRLSYGHVAGYPCNGTMAPPMTTFYGLYDRAASFGNKGDFALPKRFADRKESLDLTTPFNFVCTCDIIGGNSGSPVINRNAEIVGLIFDGNIDSLVGRFGYENERSRAVAVHSRAMTESIRAVYDAKDLADELLGTGKAQ